LGAAAEEWSCEVSEVRERILATIRNSLGRGRLDARGEAELRARVAAHRRNPVPARATALDERARVELFVAMAEEVQATVTRVGSPAGVPEAIARYLAAENLPAELVMAPDPTLDEIPWNSWPLLRIRRGRAEPEDRVSVTPCHAAIAETGTLMLVSGAHTPTTLNFLPETHIVLVRRDQVVATYEDGWDRLRAAAKTEVLPRTVNFVTGPSRTADIEQHIELGAHGPRRLHIVLVEDGGAARGEGNQGHRGPAR
jgi:L-lactate dehydrogenase complex protein LldG